MKENGKKRIAFADPNPKIERMIKESALVSEYDFYFISDGNDYREKVLEVKPDLIFIEIFMPHHHGIDLLRWSREKPDFEKTGIIITTYELMLQNYRAAYKFGANYFLEKPYTLKQIQSIINKYFAGILRQEAYSGHKSLDFGIDSYYDPKYEEPKNYFKFWGTRGSISVSGGEYTKFGGNTSCFELRYGKDLIIIDSGTGIRALGDKLIDERAHNIHLFISHTHQDHVLGFPFFKPLYFDQTQMHIYSPIGYEKHTKNLFTDMLAYSFFPVPLEQMQANIKFVDICDGDKIKVGNLTISMCYTYHPGATVGFKIKTPKQTIGYITDNEFLVGFHGHPNEITENHPILENHLNIINFLSDCDIIVHEAQYFPKEYLSRIGWGHSSMVNASILFKFIKCPSWIITHHDPRHTDQDLNYKAELHRKILSDAEIYTHIRYAYDGMVIQIP